MTSLNPKKLKVILTSLRETITAITDDSSTTTTASSNSSVAVAYTLLLVSELSSRGIGITLPSSLEGYYTNNVEFIISLLEGVQSAAGKVSIDDVTNNNNNSGSSEYPQPMMAALNAASGMTASALVTLLNNINIGIDNDQLLTLLLPMDNKQVNEAVQTTMKRCLEVNDGRFYILLKMAYDLYSSSFSNSSSSSSTTSESTEKRTLRIKQQLQSLKNNFNTIAYSYYLYGASNFGIDQMPLWKRCLDSVLLMNSLENDNIVGQVEGSTSTTSNSEYKQYQNSLTILPLQNMIRVAQTKGNTKRVNELSLLICLGYINGVKNRLDNIRKNCSSNNGEKEKKEEEMKLDKLSAYQLLTQYYLHRSNSLIDLQDYTTSKMLLDSCQESFNKVEVIVPTIDDKNYETYLLYYYVQCQIIHYREECKIVIEFQNEYKKMNNRRPDGDASTFGGGLGSSIGTNKKSLNTKSISSTKTTSKKKDMTKDEMEQYIRNKIYIDTYIESLDDIPLSSNTVTTLRDAIINLSSLSNSLQITTSTGIVQDCYSLVMHQIQRLVDVGILVQQHVNKDKKKTKEERNSDVSGIWQVVLSFVSPLMKDYLFGLVAEGSSSTSLELNSTLRRLLECFSQTIITASWMYEPLTTDTDTNSKKELFDLNSIPNLLSMAHSCLIACQKERIATEKRVLEEKKKQTSVLSSHDGQSEVEKKELIQFQCALAASKCRMDLHSAAVVNEKNGEVSTDALMSAARKATVAATKSSLSTSSSSVNSKYGSSYIQFLSAWSGLYHSPWPICTVGQARTILRNAREAMASASKVWGRDTMSIEQVLLDIAEADLEGCLMGGFENVSEKLYRQTLSSLEDQSSMDDHIKEMLKVHCLLGLARLSLSSDSFDATTEAEELARQALDILASLSDSSQNGSSSSPILLCIYAWNDPSLSQLSHSYHVCASRQLVADACIRSSRPEDARMFLTEAVKGK